MGIGILTPSMSFRRGWSRFLTGVLYAGGIALVISVIVLLVLIPVGTGLAIGQLSTGLAILSAVIVICGILVMAISATDNADDNVVMMSIGVGALLLILLGSLTLTIIQRSPTISSGLRDLLF